MIDDTSSAGGAWRRAVTDRVTPGGRVEGLARFAARLGRLGARVAPEIGDELDQLTVRLRGRWTYAQWASRTRPTTDEMTRWTKWSATAPTATSFVALVVGAGDPFGGTDQCWSRWRIERCADLAAAARWLDSSGATDRHEWVVVLDGDDRLLDGALARLAMAITANPSLDAVSFDDELRHPTSTDVPARLRPAWSPDTSLAFDLWERSVCFRLSAAVAAGGLDPELGDQGWWDLWLRIGAGETTIDGRTGADVWGRCEAVLVQRHRRHSTVGDRGLMVVARELSRRGWNATPQIDHRDGVQVVDLHWKGTRDASVLVVIPTRHSVEFLDPLIGDLAESSHPRLRVVVVDNGERTAAHEADHDRWAAQLGGRYEVLWWTDEFNYSAVNNAAVAYAAQAERSVPEGGRSAEAVLDDRPDVLVFLNDDMRCPVRRWAEPLVGWVGVDGVAVAGAQLLAPDGTIQHGGVFMGLNGLGEHLFAGTAPDRDTLVGPTDALRDVSAVTGAALAIRREVFEAVGGFDESFRLVGGDVALCLDAVEHLGPAGRPGAPPARVVIAATTPMVHLESATRGDYAVDDDAYRCWWRFQRPVRAGDPYLNGALSRVGHDPRAASPLDPDPLDLLSGHFGRDLHPGAQSVSTERAADLAAACDVTADEVAAVHALHASAAGALDIESVTWFLPDFDSPFYGGINTALRIAATLHSTRGIDQRFVMISAPHDAFFRTAIEAAYPSLAPVDLRFIDGAADPRLAEIPATDIAIATIWHSAYAVARCPGARRKAYLVQDFEPCFVPAGTEFALAEESYRLGLVALCNSDTMTHIAAHDYGARASGFTPAVDPTIFHADGRPERRADDPITVFLYARPGHWRNCWEIAAPALQRLKRRHGDGIRIVTAGSWRRPDQLDPSIDHLGLVDYAETGAVYRRADVGLALTVSRHPSYLPLELMACGVPTVTFDLGDDAAWLVEPDIDALVAPRTVSGVADALDRLVSDDELRARLARAGVEKVASDHSHWDAALLGAFDRLCGPLDRLDGPDHPTVVRRWRR